MNPNGSTQPSMASTAPSARPSTPAPGHVFRPGDLVARRYRVERFIAAGGMGAVYAVEDLELSTRVALKVLHVDASASPHALERLRREVALARRVTHVNVCRLYDFGIHLFDDDMGHLAFLTMELLEGLTLAELLAQGPVPEAKVLEILGQLAAALDAAHQAGVVHRDLKSNNIMQVTVAQGVPRIVVMDFGIAREEPANDSAVFTNPYVGTPAYMSPEQLHGQPATRQSDVYCLGVVLFELATGQRPFDAHDASTRLAGAAPLVRAVKPTLSQALETAIAGCLERNPRERWTSANQVLAAARGRKFSRRRRLIHKQSWLLGGLFFVALGSAAWLWKRATFPRSTPHGQSVAVLSFIPLSAETETVWLGNACSQLLRSELAIDPALRVSPGSETTGVESEFDAHGVALKNAELMRTIAERLHSQALVSGTISQQGKTTRLDVHITLPVSGEASTFVVSGDSADALNLISRAGAQLRQTLGTGLLSPEAERHLAAKVPQTLEAARWAAEGEAALRAFEPLKARILFERYVAAQPDSPTAHLALADAYKALDDARHERTEVERAFSLSSQLNRDERLLIEARLKEVELQWPEAARILESLYTFFPEDLEHGLRLVRATLQAGNHERARDVLAALQRLPGAIGADPRIALLEVDLLLGSQEFKEANAVAFQVVTRAREERRAHVLAAAQNLRCRLLEELGEDATPACDEAMALYQTSGNLSRMARLELTRAFRLLNRGKADEAAAMIEKALEKFDRLGSVGGRGIALVSQGNVLKAQGKLEAALQSYTQARQRLEAVGDKRNMAAALSNISATLIDLRRFREAVDIGDEAIAAARNAGSLGTAAIMLQNLAILHLNMGQARRARLAIEEALAIQRKNQQQNDLGFSLETLGLVLAYMNEADAAETALTEGLALREKLKSSLATVHQNLAEVAILRGNLESAASLAQQAVSEFEEAKAEVGTLYALQVLLRVQVLRGQVREARATLSRALTLPASKQEGERLALGELEARVKALEGDPRGAIEMLRRLVPELEAVGQEAGALSARVALAELMVSTAQRSEARATLNGLIPQLQDRGLLALARDAQRVLSPSTLSNK